MFATIPHEAREIVLDPVGNPYVEVFGNFARHLLTGEPLHADGLDGVKTAELTNAIYVSGWEECRVRVPVAEERFCRGLELRQKEEREGM